MLTSACQRICWLRSEMSRLKAGFLWPQLNRHWQEASGSSPRTSILLAALKSRPAGLGGVSVATCCDVRLRRSDGARASGRGVFWFSPLAVLSRPGGRKAACSCFSFPFPSLPLSQPGFSLLPFTRLILIDCCPGSEPFSGPGARKRAAPGPGS